MKRLAAFTAGALTAAFVIYAVFTWIEHERTFDNQEEFVN